MKFTPQGLEGLMEELKSKIKLLEEE